MNNPRIGSSSHHPQRQHGLPPNPPPMPQPPNLPLSDLLKGPREDYINVGVPLYEAAIKGDWKAARRILNQQPDLVRYAITDRSETLLHVAASAESSKAVEEFVMNLVGSMDIMDLELQNIYYDTALSLAAAVGNVKTARIMLNRNQALKNIRGDKKMMPLNMAASYAKPEMVRYLYDISDKMTGDLWEDDNRGWVLLKCVEAEIFDVALKIVNDLPELIVNKGLVTDILLVLAQKTHAFKRRNQRVSSESSSQISSQTSNLLLPIGFAVFLLKVRPGERQTDALQLLRIIWGKVAKMPKNEIDKIIRGPSVKIESIKGYPLRLLFIATKKGNTKFIIEITRLYPNVIWTSNDKGQTIFHFAIKHRQAKIYNLLYEIGAMKELITPIIDDKGNTMLHMVAKSAKQKRLQEVSGVAFQMQRELLWFKEVEEMIPPQYRKSKNGDGETAQDLFTETHAKLVLKGEKWMKNTSSQCMVVATLISTIVFAAAFTLPGGYNQDTGIPFFRKEPPLIIFVISDAISVISSSTSILMFLSILTSRYAEHDFLESLPKKLMFGLAMLFLSIVTMMVAFSASFFVLYDKKLEWVPVTMTSLAGIPVILFAILQSPLICDVFDSRNQSRYLFKPKKRMLYI